MIKNLFIVICCVALFASCDRSFPSSFIVVKNATNFKHFYTGGIDRMFYKVESPFPADATIAEIRTKLESEGWIPMKQEYLHPENATSIVTGWSFYEDPPKRPSNLIYEYLANWKDKADNIITYQFQYRDPINKFRQGTVILKPTSSDLMVNAVYMPNKVAKNMRESINRKKKAS